LYLVASPNPAVGEGTNLAAVACPSAPNCFAVGSNYIGGPGEPTTLVLQWKNGKTWSIVTDFQPSGFSELHGVSCTSRINCTAVGYSQTVLGRFNFGPQRTSVQHWNGKTWTNVKNPGGAGVLSGVSCPSTTFCIAVGTITLRWNGKNWSSVPSPILPVSRSAS
jgi:hypothetical protein